ncbi:hypothetical protein JCM10207_000604 [Rhodosporidiobolus poonsookiae]
MFYHLCRLVATTTTLLYPLYASYKVLRLPAGSPEQREGLERWCMFWCVLACVTVWEEVGEWGVGWFPFYHEVKTLALLWLVLPQIQGSTYVYINHLSPFLHSHESDIDSFVSNLRSSAIATGTAYLQRLLSAVRRAVLGQFLAAEGAADGPADPPPVLADPPTATPAANPSAAAGNSLAQFAGGLLRSYGPAALAAGQALLRPNQGRPVHPSRETNASQKRREELERELAALNAEAESSGAESSTSGRRGPPSLHGLRERSRTPSSVSSASSGVPASLSPGSTPRDPVAQRVLSSLAGSAYEEIGHEDASGFVAPGQGARKSAGAGAGGSWFGWGAGQEGKGGKDN